MCRAEYFVSNRFGVLESYEKCDNSLLIYHSSAAVVSLDRRRRLFFLALCRALQENQFSPIWLFELWPVKANSSN